MKIFPGFFVSFFLFFGPFLYGQAPQHPYTTPVQSYYQPLEQAPIYGATQSENNYYANYGGKKPQSWYYYHQHYSPDYQPEILATAPPLYHNPYYQTPTYPEIDYNLIPPPPIKNYAFPNSTQTNMLYWYLQNT